VDKQYPLHKGARSALNITGVLCCVLVVGIPLGIWIFFRAASARVLLKADELEATNAFSSTGFAYRDVARLGLLKVRVVSPGGAGGAIGGALARQRVGGDEATHIVVRTSDGKNRGFVVSSYENMQEIIDEVGQRVGKPYETVEAGALGIHNAKWP
jgi:hypothetical protein